MPRLIVPSRLSGLRRLDIPYATEGLNHASQKLDVFLPTAGGSSPWPVVLWIHGGGWHTGDKALGTLPVTDCLLNGIAVVSVNYRLSGTHAWPAHIHDCKAALRWISVHGARHHLDPRRIATWGVSAGALLSLLLATTQHVSTLSGAQGNAGGHEKLKCAISWYAPTYFPEEDADWAFQVEQNQRGFAVCSTSSQESWLLGGVSTPTNPCSGGGLTLSTEASPRTYLSARTCPLRLEHGDTDGVIPYKQSENMHTLAVAAGVTSSFHLRTGYGHQPGDWEADSALRAAQITFLQTHL